MAIPGDFPQANTRWVGKGDVGDLPVYQKKGEIISCWKLTMEERFEILSTGVIWLGIYTDTCPGVIVEAYSPFEEEDKLALE